MYTNSNGVFDLMSHNHNLLMHPAEQEEDVHMLAFFDALVQVHI
jgi:hypothetical protein